MARSMGGDWLTTPTNVRSVCFKSVEVGGLYLAVSVILKAEMKAVFVVTSQTRLCGL